MRHNVGKVDRIIRVTAGVVLIGTGFFVGGGVGTALMVVGLIPLVTGMAGNCPLYGICHIDTEHRI